MIFYNIGHKVYLQKMEIKKNWKSDAIVDKATYESMYEESINSNDLFWSKQGKRLDWIKDYTKIKNIKYSSKEVSINWFYDD